jgi:hypothetical protein
MHHSTMGMAMPLTPEGGNGILYIFFDRVMEVTTNQGVAPALVLGVAIAHEIGHLLLPGESHALAGIMRGKLEPKDWPLAAQGHLSFTDQQRETITTGLQVRNPGQNVNSGGLLQVSNGGLRLCQQETREAGRHED